MLSEWALFDPKAPPISVSFRAANISHGSRSDSSLSKGSLTSPCVACPPPTSSFAQERTQSRDRYGLKTETEMRWNEQGWTTGPLAAVRIALCPSRSGSEPNVRVVPFISFRIGTGAKKGSSDAYPRVRA
jgi:hypothetical protein